MQNPNTKAAPFGQIPVTTLGRKGYVTDNDSLLGDKLSKLDALLCLVSLCPDDLDDGNDFQGMNHHLQLEVLRLASDLAGEAHELHTITSQARREARGAAA